MEEFATEVHRRALKPRVYRKVIATKPDRTWALDLMDMQWMDKDPQFLNLNDGFRWILVVVDVFTRYAWALPQKDKTAAQTWTTFHGILNHSGRRPKYIWCDQGGEFAGIFKRNCDKEGIAI